MKKFLHKELASGKWYQLSLAEQLANIGSEVSRACKWQGRDKDIFWNATERALDLFDLTLSDKRWRGRFREIARVRELFCEAVLGKNNYKTTLADLERYFLPFAFLSQK